jgi:proline iminopeptidase
VPQIPETTGYANVPGGKVWWMRVGSGPKTPLLLLHGGPGAGHNYLLSMKALADDRPVIFYDQLGCGHSDAPENDCLYTIDRSVDELDAVRNALGLNRLVLYGNSWGSVLAIEYLIRRGSEGIEQLVLSGALASIPQAVSGMKRLLHSMPDGAGARIEALNEAGQEQSSEYQALVQMFYERHVCRVLPWPAEVMATSQIVSKSPAYRVMNGPNDFTVIGNMKDWERRGDLGAIRIPTLITTGQYDEITLDCHQTLQEAIAGSQLLVFEGCSHMTMAEKPAEYARAIRSFIG